MFGIDLQTINNFWMRLSKIPWYVCGKQMFYHLIAEFVCFFFKVGQQSAHEQTIICRTRVGISANEKEEKFATNDNNNYCIYFSRLKVIIK